MKLVRTSGSLRRAVDKIIHLARIFVHRDLVYDHLKLSARAAKAFDKAASCRRGRRSESVLSVSRALYAFPSSIGLLHRCRWAPLSPSHVNGRLTQRACVSDRHGHTRRAISRCSSPWRQPSLGSRQFDDPCDYLPSRSSMASSDQPMVAGSIGIRGDIEPDEAAN
jgi:hypothetical protein